MKKMIIFVIAALLLVSMSAMADDTYTVGISQLVQHVALDAATQGFQDALTEKLGDNVKFDVQNASGDSNTCSTIVNTFISNGVDLIMANATPALQAAVAATGDIPILGTSVTDYATALDIDDWSGATGMNVSGTSDLAPLDEQAAISAISAAAKRRAAMILIGFFINHLLLSYLLCEMFHQFLTIRSCLFHIAIVQLYKILSEENIC